MKVKIHKEGIPAILLVLILISTIWLLINYFYPRQTIFHFIIYLAGLIFWALIILFFRFPDRRIVLDENKIFCPADGKIVVIEEVEETEFLKDRRLQISIFMSPLNVHVNWYPISGVIRYFRYHKGKNLVAFNPKSSAENERTSIVLENAIGQQIMVRQIAGAVARRVVCYARENNIAKQGNDFGIVKFGSRIDLFCPPNAKINVKLNEKVRANETVIAFFK